MNMDRAKDEKERTKRSRRERERERAAALYRNKRQIKEYKNKIQAAMNRRNEKGQKSSRTESDEGCFSIMESGVPWDPEQSQDNNRASGHGNKRSH